MQIQNNLMSCHELAQQNLMFHGTGSTGPQSRSYGFNPAFLDEKTKTVYLARYPDGRIAPMHISNSLPDKLLAQKNVCGVVVSGTEEVTAGFTKDGLFYTRAQAEKAVAYFDMHTELTPVGEIR